MGRTKIAITSDIHILVKKLTTEQAGELFKAILDFGFDSVESDIEGEAGFAYEMAKIQIETARQLAENGTKGGRPRKAETTARTRKNGQKKETMIPSLTEVIDYAESLHMRTNAEEFWRYYTANDWKSGGKRIENWKALLQTWETRGTYERPRETANTTTTTETDETETAATMTESSEEKERLLAMLRA